MLNRSLALLLVSLSCAAHAEPPSAADPLTAAVHLEDVEAFAALFAETNGRPSAAQLEAHYLAPGSYGVEVFTPNRIVGADHLADAIASRPDDYRRAIQTCLPLARQSNADLRSIYLGLHGALPDADLPQIFFVFGAGNSGGTAASGAQVLGLEVLCRQAGTPAKFRRLVRHFFAHETVHALQSDSGNESLLHAVLAEGAADFIAQLVTGEEPDAERAAWALPQEAELWQQFEHDIALPASANADQRWVGNYGSPPEGWPGELGYWIGLRIWERYYAAAPDKRAALAAMLTIPNPDAVLRQGAFRDD